MTKDEIIELAQECGFSIKFYAAQFSGVLECEIADFQLVDLLNAAIAKEREACAVLCESRHENGNYKYDHRDECAQAIREKGETK